MKNLKKTIKNFYFHYLTSGTFQGRYPSANPHTLCLINRLISNSSTVLDAGCGNGRYLIPLLKRNINIFGVDLSFEMLNNAMVKAKRLNKDETRLMQADLTHLSFKSNSFDIVLCIFGVFAHLDTNNRIKAINEIWRVLKVNGLLILSLPNRVRRFYLNQLRSFIIHLSRRNMKYFKIGDVRYYRKFSGKYVESFYHLFFPKEIKQFLKSNNFENIKIRAESLISESFSIKNAHNLFNKIESKLMEMNNINSICYDFLCISQKKES